MNRVGRASGSGRKLPHEKFVAIERQPSTPRVNCSDELEAHGACSQIGIRLRLNRPRKRQRIWIGQSEFFQVSRQARIIAQRRNVRGHYRLEGGSRRRLPYGSEFWRGSRSAGLVIHPAARRAAFRLQLLHLELDLRQYKRRGHRSSSRGELSAILGHPRFENSGRCRLPARRSALGLVPVSSSKKAVAILPLTANGFRHGATRTIRVARCGS
jgi:hypothetical protein